MAKLDELDAVAAAPEHHEVLLEDERVRVLRTRIRPGERTPDHTHVWPCVSYVLSFAHLLRRDGEGRVLWDSRVEGSRPEAGTAYFGAPMPLHSAENVGDTDIEVVMVEFKD
jgi:hypothetical protein